MPAKCLHHISVNLSYWFD